METTEKKLKVVISPAIASKLCEMGFPIVKIKPKRTQDVDSFKCNTVFLFEETESFLKAFTQLQGK